MSTTLRRNTPPDPTTADGQPPEAETRMRQALGLLPSASRTRPRGGDGPVVEHRGDRQAGSSVNRVAAAEAALVHERQAREQVARQLREVETALREAQTKRGHAELARDEALAALAAERAAREAAEERIKDLSAAAQSQGPQPETTISPAPARRGRPRLTAVASEAPAPAKRRGRPPGSKSKTGRTVVDAPARDSDSDGAVEWWVPGWQERL
jgi:hypothetical protein